MDTEQARKEYDELLNTWFNRELTDKEEARYQELRKCVGFKWAD